MWNIQRELEEALEYSGDCYTVFSPPFDGSSQPKEEIAVVPIANEETINRKIDRLAPSKTLTANERIDAIREYSERLRKNVEKYALIASKESGIPFIDMYFRINYTLSTDPQEYAEAIFGEKWKRILDGEWLEIPAKIGKAYEKRIPHGVYLNISPNNDSIGVSIKTKLELLLAGNKVIDKPGSIVPVAHTLSMKIVKEVLPEHTDVLIGPGSKVPYVAMENKNLAGIMFTGESRHGRLVEAEAIKHGVKYRGEYEGSNVQLVLKDYDVEMAALLCAHGARAFNGIACANAPIASFEDKKNYKLFKERLVELASEFNEHIGDPSKKDTLVGPLVKESLAEKCEKVFKACRESGLEILVGGERRGYLVEFTLIEGEPWKIAEKVRDLNLRYSLEHGLFAGPLLFFNDDFKGTLEWVIKNSNGREGYALRNNILTYDEERAKRMADLLGSSMNVTNIYLFEEKQRWAGRGRSSTLGGKPLVEMAMDSKILNVAPKDFNPFRT